MSLKWFGNSARRVVMIIGGVALVGAAVSLSGMAAAEEGAFVIPPPKLDENRTTAQETAVLAGGCFWGVQGVFQHVKGVENAVSGYAGGEASTANYDRVSGGDTGHAESVQVTFDPRIVSYGQILQVYFSVAHDPTQLNYQRPDHGTQYRSAIFYANFEQKKIAEAYVAQLDHTGIYKNAIVTKIGPLQAFYPAEGYHQDFLTLNPNYPYIVFNDLPKIANLKTVFPALYRDKPALVSEAKG
jgi:peptide-methionine (S)-S-oxide reductase